MISTPVPVRCTIFSNSNFSNNGLLLAALAWTIFISIFGTFKKVLVQLLDVSKFYKYDWKKELGAEMYNVTIGEIGKVIGYNESSIS